MMTARFEMFVQDVRVSVDFMRPFSDFLRDAIEQQNTPWSAMAKCKSDWGFCRSYRRIIRFNCIIPMRERGLASRLSWKSMMLMSYMNVFRPRVIQSVNRY